MKEVGDWKQIWIALQQKSLQLSQYVENNDELIDTLKSSSRYQVGDKAVKFFNKLRGKSTVDTCVQKIEQNQKEILSSLEDLGILIDEINEISPVKQKLDVFRLLDYFPILKFFVGSKEKRLSKSIRRLSDEFLASKMPLLNSPLVSIIMPVYNREKLIGKAVESVLNQTYQNWELLIVDDCSTDATVQRVKDKFTDQRVKLFRLKNKGGVSKARNRGLAEAKGGYIAYLDSDNVWYPKFLEASLYQLQKTNREIGSSGQDVTRYTNGQKSDVGIRLDNYYESLLENKNFMDLNAFIHHRKFYDQLGGFDEEMTRLVDWDLMLRYVQEHTPTTVPAILGEYIFRDDAGQITDLANYGENLSKLKNKFFYDLLDSEVTQSLGTEHSKLYHLNKPVILDLEKESGVSIIIPSYEVLDCLKASILSIEKYSPVGKFEIVVVDNNSSNEVVKYLSDLEKEGRIKLVLNKENFGYSYAINQAIKIANPAFDLVLFNNDAIATKGWVEGFYQAKAHNPKAGLIVPRQVLPANTKTINTHVPSADENFETDVNLSIHHNNIVGEYLSHGLSYVEVDFAAFFCVFVTREAFDKLGYLDHVNGRHYKSDRLYCEKAKEFGIQIVYTPRSKVYHLLQQATGTLKKSKKKYDEIFLKNTWGTEAPQN